MGYSSILLEDQATSLSDAQRHALDRIQINSHELLACVEGLFFLAALEAGEVPMTAWTFDARQIIETLPARHAAAFAEKGVSLELGELPTLPIRTDEEKVTRLLDTLVLNALKFTETGSVHVDGEMLGDGRLELRVRDSGIGMRPDEISEVLEGFKQGDPTARKRFRGIGLGLRLVTRLVAALGGELAVESTLGAGSEFTLRVPPLDEGATQSTGPDAPPAAVAAPQGP
jgi:signal transduction histidine kinase